MDGLLLEENRKENDSGDWMECVGELRAELTQVRDEVGALRRENLELRQQVGYWKSMHARALERIAVLEQENELLRGENRLLRQQAFGKKSEKQSCQDRSNRLEGFDDKDSSESQGAKKKQRGPKRRDFSHLPAKEEIVELPADERLCPTCSKPGLTRFVADARIPMDNNASERSLRGAALGRKIYYGSGAEWSGQLAMMLFSVFATLPKWNINPRSWLRWYLDACATAGGQAPSDLQPFLPWNLSAEQRRTMAEPISAQVCEQLVDSS